jgi:ferric-dicitrate binding protein FerR (iron transport regulator)
MPGSGEEATSARKTILKWGQQAILRENEIKVSNVPVDDAVAWKNGMFVFKDADLKTVMKTISRWYDVEVEYEGLLPQNSLQVKCTAI